MLSAIFAAGRPVVGWNTIEFAEVGVEAAKEDAARASFNSQGCSRIPFEFNRAVVHHYLGTHTRCRAPLILHKDLGKIENAPRVNIPQ